MKDGEEGRKDNEGGCSEKEGGMCVNQPASLRSKLSVNIRQQQTGQADGHKWTPSTRCLNSNMVSFPNFWRTSTPGISHKGLV